MYALASRDSTFRVQRPWEADDRERSLLGLYFTFTLTNTVVQQHCSPPPPSPDVSLTCARMTYSPGAAKVAAVVASRKTVAVRVVMSGMCGCANVTSPGPRCFRQFTVMSGGVGVMSEGAGAVAPALRVPPITCPDSRVPRPTRGCARRAPPRPRSPASEHPTPTASVKPDGRQHLPASARFPPAVRSSSVHPAGT